jgi:hypothetical protein
VTTTISLDAAGGAVVRDMPHDQYLAHPALSASGAKLIVQPGGPARFRYRQEHPEPPRDAFDLGTAAHTTVLGTGPELAVIDADSWRTKAAQAERDAARAEGRVPVLVADAQRVQDMANALRAHPVAGPLMHPDAGDPEVSIFWHDDEHDVDRRCRVDFLRRANPEGRLLLVDYKTCQSAAPDAVDRAIANWGYHQAGSWYRDLIVGTGLARFVPVLLVFQEVSAPYLVHVVELDETWLMMGDELNRRALRTYAECVATDTWPGYESISLSIPPRWATFRHDELVADEQ